MGKKQLDRKLVEGLDYVSVRLNGCSGVISIPINTEKGEVKTNGN
jgi:hypothetical protein